MLLDGVMQFIRALWFFNIGLKFVLQYSIGISPVPVYVLRIKDIDDINGDEDQNFTNLVNSD